MTMKILSAGLRSGALALLCAGTALAAQPTAPTATRQAAETPVPIRNIFGLRTKMRDGVELVSDVWLPAAPGKYPVILTRTPYVKSQGFTQAAKWGVYFAQRGYAFVIQDVRGRGDSDGKFGFFFVEGNDGYDSVEGLASEPWSSGRVCMMGVSYLGTTQWLAARERPPHLACIAPTSPGGRYVDELPYVGGAFMLYWALEWMNDTSGRVSQGGNAGSVDWAKVLSHRPLLTADEALGRRLPFYREFLQHDTLDDYWKRIDFTKEDFAKIDIPVMTTTGWFDGDQAGALHYWNGMQGRSVAAADQYLVIGPWTHVQSFQGGSGQVGGFKIPPSAILDSKASHLAFFDRYLKQSTDRLDMPQVRLFVTGADIWRDFDSFPVRGTSPQRLYLSSGGNANTSSGDGVLAWQKATRQPADKFTYDPTNPVPIDTAAGLFGVDRSKEQSRKDVLVYTTEALAKPVEVIGSITLELYAATDGRDTDFTVAISDVRPDGKPLLLGSKPVGIIRARYRHGREAAPSLLTPGKTELYKIDLGAFAHRFLPGHRIRIEVSSSYFPYFNPNSNTGNPIATDTEWRIAEQTVFHDASRPSALILPVFPQ